MIEMRVSFQDEARKRIGLLSPRLLKNLHDAVKQAALIVQGTIKKKISHGPRSGRIYSYYRGGKRPITHQTSAPGEPPKTDTGRLVNSIRTNFMTLSAEVGSDVKYSEFLELGTSKMAARPWLQASFEESSGQVEQLIDKAISEAMK